ncbi:aminoglycoside phosphotransferase family protein [Actinomadura barringtoniae]|uniref:Aminoglycoside phosphotransferase family protein n=1 Tax=Actinomadura barringtoniae TaxID=1427535 RepID=A0A939PPV7_9ACTN|nr:aminoglycoside phosphotransferase family protein [Actinomadura barringtoniae]MBO2454008.1 aminoglycoside phosphotransferase family protein [Actinomadura barringtoniae]
MLYDRHGVLVVRVGDIVVKAHQADRDGGPLLKQRMDLAATLPELLLPPLGGPHDVDGRVVTLWPYARPVDPTQALPWAEAGSLLARLHNSPVPADAPPWGRPTRVTRLIARLTSPAESPEVAGFAASNVPADPPEVLGAPGAPARPSKASRSAGSAQAAMSSRPAEATGPGDLASVTAPNEPAAPAKATEPSRAKGLGRYASAVEAVVGAYATLPERILTGAPLSPERARLLHGDWHLGQMVNDDGAWRLIDVEDLGVGDPAWDLARPAALFAAGVLPPDDWSRFLTAYQEAGGPAVPVNGDPWQALDLPSRTLAIQIAATCVISAREGDRPLDEPEEALVEACTRISRSRAPGMT